MTLLLQPNSVLDHGYVKHVDHMGDDLTPLEYARMSTDNPTGVDEEKDDRLRGRLWNLKHTSPFEGPVLCVELMVPLFVLRQIDRHRTVDISNPEVDILFSDYDDFRKWTSRNEFSARYSIMPEAYYIPSIERLRASGKSVTNKQGSGGSISEAEARVMQDTIRIHSMAARKAYEDLLEMGMASELARAVLPTNQYTKIRLQANMLHWYKFLRLRLPEEAQWETRQYAEIIAAMMEEIWPRSSRLALDGLR